MSPADFATALTLSIALVVRLFGWLAWSMGATLPVPAAPVVWKGAGWLRSDLLWSGPALSEAATIWGPCSCAGTILAGVSNTNAATTDAASDAIVEKGR